MPHILIAVLAAEHHGPALPLPRIALLLFYFFAQRLKEPPRSPAFCN